MRTVEEAKALISKVSMRVNIKSYFLFKGQNFFIQSVVVFILQKQVQANVCITMEMIKEALDQLRGAVMIVYPMGLPPHDPIRMEFEDQEDLSGTQVNSWTCPLTVHLDPISFWSFLHPPLLCICPLHLSPLPQASLQVITEDECQLWWAAKEMQRGKKLQDYIGKNEKTKLIIKIQKVRVRILWYVSGYVFFEFCE